MRGKVARVGAVLASLGAVSACRQLVGIGDDPPMGPCNGAAALYQGACGACAASSCCAEATACANSSGCAPYATCLAGCNGEPGCRSQCTIDNQLSLSPEVSALGACIATSCEAPCGLTCGGFGAYVSSPDAAPACEHCLTSNCAGPQNCASSADCDAYQRCVTACQSVGDCTDACATQHDAGAALYAAFQNVYSGSCREDCEFGNYWACVGHVSWPQPTAPTSDVVIDLRDVLNLTTPIPFADVKFCPLTDPMCPPGAPDGVSDSNGTATISLPLTRNSSLYGPNGYMQITPPTPDGGPPSIVTLDFWGFPLGASQWHLRAPSRSIAVATNSDAVTLLDAFGLKEGPDAGYAGAFVTDCFGNASPGAVVTTDIPPDAGSRLFYVDDPTNGKATGNSGSVGILDVPAGGLQLTAYPSNLGGNYSSRVSVRVRPGGFSAAGMPPQPR